MRTNQRSQLGRVRTGVESDLSEDFEGEGGISLRWGKTAHYKNVHRWDSESNFVLGEVPPKGFRQWPSGIAVLRNSVCFWQRSSDVTGGKIFAGELSY